MRNAKRLLAALLLAAALILSSASCGGRPKRQAKRLPPRLPNRSGITPCRSPRTPCAAQGSTSPPAAHRLGLTNVTTNDDGLLHGRNDKRRARCRLRRAEGKSARADLALPEDGTWPFIKSVTLSEDGRQRRNSEYQRACINRSADNAAAQAVYIPALLYAAFTGEDAESFTVHFTVKDETTGDVLGAFDYPAAEPTASESDASGTESTAPSPDTAE